MDSVASLRRARDREHDEREQHDMSRGETRNPLPKLFPVAPPPGTTIHTFGG